MQTDSSPNQLLDIHDVKPLDDEDYECLEAVRDVLRRHGKSSRFGVALLHKHFDLDEGEILVEWTDVENREQTIRPESASEVDGSTIETIWQLGDGVAEPVMRCIQYCGANIHGGHSSFHKSG